MASNGPVNDTMYFGFGSNLWREQMAQRCPTSKYLGIGRLPNHKWIINDRGYANVIASSEKGAEVWGLVYSLKPVDEEFLDLSEGVPFSYTKESLEVDFWPTEGDGVPVNVTTTSTEKKDMLVYIDPWRTNPSKPRLEYIFRMNKGIKDAVRHGVSNEYVEKVMRKFIPDVDDQVVGKSARSEVPESWDQV